MNSNNEEPWITMNDFVEIDDTEKNAEKKQEPEKQEPEKKEAVKKKKPRIEYDKALEEFYAEEHCAQLNVHIQSARIPLRKQR